MDIEKKVIAFQKRIDELFDMKEAVVPNRVGLKLSSEVVVNEDGLFNARLINPLARRCSALMDLPQPYEIFIISSGAFALGSADMQRRDSSFDPTNCSIATRQVIASAGQIELAHSWKQAFLECGNGKPVVQFLISDHDWIGKNPKDTQRKIENLRRPLLHALKMRMIALDNGNDGTNDTGMKELVSAKDNDPLAVIRALMVRAKYLIMGTNVDGILDKDRQAIPEMTSLDDLKKVFDHGRLNGRGMTTGGHISKIGAGFAFGREGREAFIVNANMLYAIEDILAGKIGTRIAIAA